MNIFIPFIGMITLTLAVWIVMYAKRLVWISKHDIDPNSIATPETLSATIPDQVNHASNNFKNLFELPVLFYALCLYLNSTGQVDYIYIYLAYAFFVFRCLHSIVQCSINHISARFSLYMLSSLALWAMLVRCVIAIV